MTKASPFRVVLDPGHGGVESGAERYGVWKKDLIASLCPSAADTLVRDGMHVVMTSNTDHFVALETRGRHAQSGRGDLFISLHADRFAPKAGRRVRRSTRLSDDASDFRHRSICGPSTTAPYYRGG